ncbi:MAG: 30S ribosomal protein S12 methylthiotransferase RimO [Bryobacterales bacterium]|nr:30S ribosomal protein S12 methylthiotransferase RimO [Bryobacteraceae bacterium]MDW8130039.1 30S ribosomal protein S12 methylthiotransferase RimO [Bryobacterales bacterium]
MKIGFVSLGCPKNLVDSEIMMGRLVERGHQIVSDAGQAEVLVINTCAFIQPACQESVNAILEMAEHKRSGSAKRLIVTGCLVERYRDEIRREIPEVDAVLDTDQIGQIVAACEGRQMDASRAPYLYDERAPRLLATPGHYAYVKIAEGCDHTCSFCIIPQLRGRFRSRQPDSVVAEVASLLARGVREIVLVAQDSTSYGEDLGLRDGLAHLLERLARLPAACEYWVRFLYAYPNRVTQRLLDAMAAHPRIAPYLDMPLQHASAAVLRRMRRGGGAERFLRLIERVRRTVPGVALRSTFIVGFPGESERDFEELCQFLEAARFQHAGVFGYSDEETAPSFRLPDKVDRRTIYHRKRRLMAIQRRISRAWNRSLVGRELPVLVEGPSPETEWLWQGRLATQAPEIDGVCLINDVKGPPPARGQIRPLRITRAHDYDLVGTLLEPASDPQADRPTRSPVLPCLAR